MDAAPAQRFRPGTVPGGRHVLWIGPSDGLELEIARRGLAELVPVVDRESPRAAIDAYGSAKSADETPLVAALAADRPGRFTASDAVLLSRRWPLVPIVSVASSLADGRRRSGPALPGVDEIPWHDLAARCRWWLAADESGLPTSLGLPSAGRREERLLATIGGIRRRAAAGPFPPLDLSVSAGRPEDLDGLCDLLSSLGHRVASRHVGRPRPEDPVSRAVWDVRHLAPEDIEWVRLLVANRPDLCLVLLAGFPRGDAVRDALRAGAAAVLGRPVAVEAIAGAMLQLLPKPA